MKSIFLLCFFGLSTAVIFECEFGMHSWSAQDLYTCYRPKISNVELPSLLEVIGVHAQAKADLDVHGLYIQSEMIFMPKEVELFFPNLKFLQLHLANLQVITADTLKFPNLVWFSSHTNKLTSVDGDLFKNTLKLQYIAIYNSQLEHAGKGLLDNLRDLQTVEFRLNNCVNVAATNPQAIQQLKQTLLTDCPPKEKAPNTTESTTTSSETCNLTCSIFDEIDMLKSQLNLQAGTIANQSKSFELLEEKLAKLENKLTFEADKVNRELNQQRQENSIREERIVELEKSMREIVANSF
jgi:hypothetical protein